MQTLKMNVTKTGFAKLLIMTIILESSESLCSYPMWTIPDTGTDSRCDFSSGCPMRPEPPCDDVYGVGEGEICSVYCARNADLSESWECIGDETWELRSDAVDCSQELGNQDLGNQYASSFSTFCSYPMWTIPDTGTDSRCDFPGGCPMRPEPNCDDIYGIFQGESCDVYCANNETLVESWECIGNETWELNSNAVDCSQVAVEQVAS